MKNKYASKLDTLCTKMEALNAEIVTLRDSIDEVKYLNVQDALLDAEIDVVRAISALEMAQTGEYVPEKTDDDILLSDALPLLAAEGREISQVRLKQLCQQGRIPGATKIKNRWHINRYAIPVIAKDIRDPGRPVDTGAKTGDK